MAKLKKLTDKQKLFVEYYLQTWNATKAAELAGYSGTYATLRSIGSENLTKPNIKAAIDKRMAKIQMSTDEVLFRLSQQARGSIGEFITIKEGEGFEIDLEKVKEFGHLVRRIRETRYGFEIELHDSQDALTLIGKHLKLFTEQIRVDWQLEALEKGISPGEIFNAMVAFFMEMDVEDGA